MRSPALVVAALVASLGTVACNETEHIDLVFRAPVGSRAAFTVAVDSSVTTELVGPSETTHERIDLGAEQIVRSRSGTVSDLRITMTRSAERARVFDVRLDSRGGLAEVDRVEGLPVEALGELGPSRLILLASGLLPARPLRAGGRWTIARDLELPEGKERLTGTGRLASLRVENGRELARVRAVTSLPVDRTLNLPVGRVRLRGTETTTALLDYRVADGTVDQARSVTTGDFTLVVTPPEGDQTPVEGTLSVRVESRTLRTA